MTHLDERTILELRDGVSVDADQRGHVHECARCRHALEQASARALEIGIALGALDEGFDVEAAKVAVRARLDGRVPVAAPRPRTQRAAVGGLSSRWSLGKAAALLLVVAGAASALPGSPVRAWLAEGEAEDPAETLQAPRAPERVGGRLTVAEGPVSIVLDGAPAGTAIDIVWVSGSAITVRAAAGSAFSYGEARVSVVIAGGPVSVEVPATLRGVSLVVNGRTYMTGSRESLESPGPVHERSDSTIAFIVSGE